jgi:hypothetical protein
MSPERLVTMLAPFVRAVRIDRLHRIEMVSEIYTRAGLEDAMSDAYFERTERELVGRFEAAGVRVHALDDLGSLLRS